MPSLRWYVQRLAAMSGAEMLYRSSQAARVASEQLRSLAGDEWPSDDALWRGLGRSGAPDWRAWAQHAAARHAAVLRPSDARRRAFDAAFPGEAARLIARGRDAAAGRITVFDRDVDLGVEPNWHRDPRSGREWPAGTFYGAIDIRGGGAKGIWEAARHQHLVPVAQAIWLGETALAEPLTRTLASWFAQQRWRRGVHWCSGLELGVRLTSWTWIAALAGDRINATVWRDWTREVVRYGSHLSHHLSRFSSANNHLIGEATGLVLAARFAPEWHEASAWEALGRRVLVEEIERQILADGTPAEQAFHYAGFVLDFYFLLIRLVPDLLDAGAVRDRLGAACAFVSQVANATLTLPVVGDDDGGTAFVVADEGTTWAARLAVTAAYTGRGDLKARGGALPPAAWWLLSDRDLDRYQSIHGQAAAPVSHQFTEGGYAVLRAGGHAEPMAVVDCGPLGYLSIAAHGHADSLSVCLSVNGEWVLVDPGTFVYHEQPEWRAHFRGTRAHNTLAVAGEDQSVQTGHTMWGRRAQSSWIPVAPTPRIAWTEGEHDGYTRLDTPSVHRRLVGLADAGYVLVVDWLTAEARGCLWHYQCAIGTVATASGDVKTVSPGGTVLYWQPLFESSLDVRLGQERPIAGWVSPHFGQKVAAPAIEIGATMLPLKPYVTVIGIGATHAASITDEDGGWTVTVPHQYGADRIALRKPESGRSTLVAVDARWNQG